MKKQTTGGKGACLSGLAVGAAGLIALGGVGYYLLGYSRVPGRTPNPVDLDRLRQLALKGGEPLPVRINAMVVAEGAFPSALVVAGSGLKNRRLAVPVFQIVYADGSSIVVDAADSPEMHRQMFGSAPFSSEAYAQLQSALTRSRLILLTHEHYDHVGGLAKSPAWEQIKPRVRMTRAQLANLRPETGFTPAMLGGLAALDDSAQAAPGVALWAMPGHSAGSQLIYVRLQSGAEYILAGDVIWSGLSLEKGAGRSRLASLFLGEDPNRHAEQVRALMDLSAAAPELRIVVSHDYEQIEGYIRAGILGGAFEKIRG